MESAAPQQLAATFGLVSNIEICDENTSVSENKLFTVYAGKSDKPHPVTEGIYSNMYSFMLVHKCELVPRWM